MEISYYFECDKRLEEVKESLLDCFTENAITAELLFGRLLNFKYIIPLHKEAQLLAIP